jgi:hypothetical protein
MTNTPIASNDSHLHERRTNYELVARWLGICLVFITAVFFRIWNSSNEYFWSDTASYVRASEVGIGALYFQSHSLSVLGLIRDWRDPDFRRHPFDVLDRQGDNLSATHLHGPGAIYALALFKDLSLSEWQQRILWSIIGALGCALLSAVLLVMGVGIVPALGAGMLAALEPANISINVDPNPVHSLYLALVMAALLLIAYYWRSGRSWALYGCAVVVAAATLTFELAPALLVSVVAGLVWATWNRQGLRLAMRFAGVYVVSVFLLSPGAILRGTILISVFGQFGVLLRQHIQPKSWALTDAGIFIGPHGEYAVLVAFGLVSTWLLVRRISKQPAYGDGLLVTYGLYAGCAILFGFAAHFRYAAYTAEAFSPMLLFVVLATHETSVGRQRWLISVLSVVLILAAADRLMSSFHEPPKPVPARQMVADIKGLAPECGTTVLVNDVSSFDGFRLYLPCHHFELTTGPANDQPRNSQDELDVRLVLFDATALEPESREHAQRLYPPRFVYHVDKEEWWLGEKAPQ